MCTRLIENDPLSKMITLVKKYPNIALLRAFKQGTTKDRSNSQFAYKQNHYPSQI